MGECRHTQVRSTHPWINSSATESLLHNVSLTCERIQTYPGEIYHPPIDLSCTEPYYTRSVWDVEECRHTQVRSTPTPIEASATEPYYIMSVWHMAEWRCTHVRCTPPHSLNPLLQSSTTPCQFDMWQNADVPTWDPFATVHM